MTLFVTYLIEAVAHTGNRQNQPGGFRGYVIGVLKLLLDGRHRTSLFCPKRPGFGQLTPGCVAPDEYQSPYSGGASD